MVNFAASYGRMTSRTVYKIQKNYYRTFIFIFLFREQEIRFFYV